jgi:hypothetical protein
MNDRYLLRIPIVALIGVLLLSQLIRGWLAPHVQALANPAPGNVVAENTTADDVAPASGGRLTTPTPPPTVTPVPTITPGPCPVATAEPLWVQPVTSPTGLLTQTITIYAGRALTVTVSSESGVFTQTVGSTWPARITIDLLPQTTHHLTVKSSVARSVVNGCVYGGYTLQTTRDSAGNPLTIVQTELAPTTPTITPLPTVTPDPTVTPCPMATPEPLWVDPVVSPTGLLTQTIVIYAGGALTVTVSSESGVFTQTVGSTWPARITIDLLPQTAHHLTVESHIPRRVVNGCAFGGYSLRATSDRNGNPLTIVQSAGATPTPAGTTPTVPATQNERELYLPLLRR